MWNSSGGTHFFRVCICGGVAAEFDLGGIVAIIRKVIDFLDDYIPQLIKGLKDGFNFVK